MTHAVTGHIKQHPVGAFIVMAYASAWTIFLPAILSRAGLGILPITVPVLPLVALASLLGIALPAFVVTAIADGRPGVRALRQRYLCWRVGLPWYLVALVGFPLACIVAVSVWLRGAPLHALSHQWPQLFTALVPRGIIIALLISVWEETGWTGVLLPRLQARYGPLRASLLIALPWGLVHTPLILVAGALTDARIPLSQYPLWVLYLVVFPAPFRFLITWIFNSTRGNLLLVAIFHGIFDATTGDKTLLPSLTGGADTIWVYAVLAVAALLVMGITRGRLGYRPGITAHSAAARPIYARSIRAH